jgi:hypothetical protein
MVGAVGQLCRCGGDRDIRCGRRRSGLALVAAFKAEQASMLYHGQPAARGICRGRDAGVARHKYSGTAYAPRAMMVFARIFRQ